MGLFSRIVRVTPTRVIMRLTHPQVRALDLLVQLAARDEAIMAAFTDTEKQSLVAVLRRFDRAMRLMREMEGGS